MSDRHDLSLIRLAVAYNALAQNGDLGKLPLDLQGKVIPNQVQAHEDAVEHKASAKSAEGGARGSFDSLDLVTEALLVRARHAILAAYPAGDARVEAYGPLGVGKNAAEDQQRLAALAVSAEAPFKSGELPLAADLAPQKLAAQAAAQLAARKSKGGATASRQSEGDGLAATRAATAQMLQRVKNFVKSFHGPRALSSYGFDVPLPSARPRLQGVADTAPAKKA